LVVLSLFDRFLKYTTTFESDSDDRSGGSETYESADEATPNACGEVPKPVKLEAAFALLACDFAVRLLMVGLEGPGGLCGLVAVGREIGRAVKLPGLYWSLEWM
jgi:hypothetical protein